MLFRNVDIYIFSDEKIYNTQIHVFSPIIIRRKKTTTEILSLYILSLLESTLIVNLFLFHCICFLVRLYMVNTYTN